MPTGMPAEVGGTLVVGDVHGCHLELTELLDRTRPRRLFLAGDIFSKGPGARACWNLIALHGAQAVLGNHDAKMLRVWDEAMAGDGCTEAHEAVRALDGDKAVRRWLEGLPLILEQPGILLVHAGLHPTLGKAGTQRTHALTLRRWPDDHNGGNPFWWQLWPRNDRTLPLVVHGHDAMRGLQDHRPSTLGLDSGCVYGGALTGYLVEQDRLVDVPARQTWLAPSG